MNSLGKNSAILFPLLFCYYYLFCSPFLLTLDTIIDIFCFIQISARKKIYKDRKVVNVRLWTLLVIRVQI